MFLKHKSGRFLIKLMIYFCQILRVQSCYLQAGVNAGRRALGARDEVTCGLGFGIRILDFICDLDFGIRILEFGFWNLEFGIWNLEFGIWNLEFLSAL